MKIYLLIMLIGALLTAVHFTSAPETAVGNASAISFYADPADCVRLPLKAERSADHGFASGKFPSRPESPAPFY